MIDESTQAILDKLDVLSSQIDLVNSSLNVPNSDVTLAQNVSSMQQTLLDMSASSTAYMEGNVDYSQQLHDVCQLLTYTDMLLLVTLVFVVILAGVLFGKIVTDRMKVHK